jgi:hypothetical protein
MNNNENRKSAAKQIELKQIPGWEGLYSISQNGDVYSIKSNKFLKPRQSMDGYNRVCFCINGSRYEQRVAKLVAMTYIPNPENKPQVNHKDYNRINDSIDNLEWCTNLENSKYSFNEKRYMIPETYKVYTFTNIFNGNSFSIIGISNVAKQFGCSKKNFKACITKYVNSNMYVKQGFFKGLRIDSEYLKVQRLSLSGVDSSESKCRTPEKGEDIV